MNLQVAWLHSKLKARLSYIVRPFLKKKKERKS
jgi:hypothetical protein